MKAAKGAKARGAKVVTPLCALDLNTSASPSVTTTTPALGPLAQLLLSE